MSLVKETIFYRERKYPNFGSPIRKILKDFYKYQSEEKSESKQQEIETKKFKFDWEGGLSEIKDKFTSIQLQHKALEWR